MTMAQADPARAAYECFLVEDVILTLGNLRGSLAWLGGDPDKARAGIDRIDRQLALLEDRARDMARRLLAEGAADPANLFAADDGAGRADAEDGDSLTLAILHSLADSLAGGLAGGPGGAAAAAPVFRSRRA